MIRTLTPVLCEHFNEGICKGAKCKVQRAVESEGDERTSRDAKGYPGRQHSKERERLFG